VVFFQQHDLKEFPVCFQQQYLNVELIYFQEHDLKVDSISVESVSQEAELIYFEEWFHEEIRMFFETGI
jgi:hypothetical protein